MSRTLHSNRRATLNVFGYDVVLGRDSNLSPSLKRADALNVTPQSLVKIWHYYPATNNDIYLFYMSVECAPLAEAIAAGRADGPPIFPGVVLGHVTHQVMVVLQKKNN